MQTVSKNKNIDLLQLIKGCCQNNVKAQSKVYQLFAGKLFGLCLKYSKNKEDAEDVLQDSFITVFKKIKQYKDAGSFEGWMKRIAINTALQKYRDKSPLYIEKFEDFHKEEELIVDENQYELDYLLDEIQQLPDRYRLVFNLYVLDKYSHKEISKLLNISEGTSKSNLHRAKSILKNKIGINQQKQIDG